MPALSAEGTPLSCNDLCCNDGDAWGKSSTAGDPGQPPPVVCHMGTPMCAQAESSGAPRAQKGLRDKVRGAVWVLGSGAQHPQLCQQHCASHPAVGRG